MRKTIAFVLMVLMAAVPLVACDNEPPSDGWGEGFLVHNIAQSIFGSLTLSASLYTDKGNGEDVVWAIEDCMEQINLAVNTTNSASELYSFNASSSTDYIEIGQIFYELTQLSQYYYELTDGYFDPTVYPLVRLWGMSSDLLNNPSYAFEPPSPEQALAMLEYCDIELVEIKAEDGKYYIKKSDPRVMLDFGAIAKGYAADRIVDIFEQYDLPAATFTLSGNWYSHGKKFLTDYWSVGVTNPFNYNPYDPSYFCVFKSQSESAVTSGDYVRARLLDGVTYAHIIDPKRAMPVNVYHDGTNYYNQAGGVVQSTIVNASSTLCDAFSTASMLMGAERGTQFLVEQSVRGILLTADNKYAISGEFTLFDDVFTADKYYRYREMEQVYPQLGELISSAS